MRILITGICGFAGCTLARGWRDMGAEHVLYGVDNLIRPGSESNRSALRTLGISVFHGDIRVASDFENLPEVDWVIDAAANPSVLAGVDGRTSSRQLIEHNLLGTTNLLEFCRRTGAGFILLSTSRVYSISPLASLPMRVTNQAFEPAPDRDVAGLSAHGVAETFSSEPPLSLYGATKFASERLALEYAATFGFPVCINRCGVLAGAGQFGRADQGIYSYWIHSWAARRPLAYIGFDGCGYQVRDCLHPRDLLPLLDAQMASAGDGRPRVVNVSGGAASACSLRQLSAWCTDRFGPHAVTSRSESRPFDIPWMVLDNNLVQQEWGWTPSMALADVLEEIATHAIAHPDWLDVTSA